MINVSSFESARNGSCQVRVELSNGESYIIGFMTQNPLKLPDYFKNLLEKALDSFEQRGDSDLFNYLRYYFVCEKVEAPLFVMPDNNVERERIGERIRSLRFIKNIDAKTLARLSDIDPANLSRIEQGKYSVGFDILCRIALALDSKVDLVEDISSFGNTDGISLRKKVWLVPIGDYEHYDPYNSIPEFGYTLMPISEESIIKNRMEIGDYIVFYNPRRDVLYSLFVLLDPAMRVEDAEPMTRDEQEYYWPRENGIHHYLKARPVFSGKDDSLPILIQKSIKRAYPKMPTSITEVRIRF